MSGEAGPPEESDSELLRDGARLVLDTAERVAATHTALNATQRGLIDTCHKLRDTTRELIDTCGGTTDELIDTCESLNDSTGELGDLAHRLIHRAELLTRAAELTRPAGPPAASAPGPGGDRSDALRLLAIVQGVTLAGASAIWVTGLLIGHLPYWVDGLGRTIFGISLGVGLAVPIIRRRRAGA